MTDPLIMSDDSVAALQRVHDVAIANLRALVAGDNLSDANEFLASITADSDLMQLTLGWIALGIRAQFLIEGKDAT